MAMAENKMIKYNQFVDSLKRNLVIFETTPKESWNEIATHYVDGLATKELRRLIDLNTRRLYGAFFTDSSLAKQVLKRLKPKFDNNSILYDPACGAGNLLIAASNYLFELNIVPNCNNFLLGTDLHKEFVEATQLQLKINTLLNAVTDNAIDKTFGTIKVADGLLDNDYYKKATHIFVNPPFNQLKTDEKVSWANGKVSAAALFIDKIIKNCLPGTSIIAILPDVLRSGSRYEKWRRMIFKNCTIKKTILFGQFDKYTDVDVYAINLIKREKQLEMVNEVERPAVIDNNVNQTLDALFNICVGPVVDNRDEHKGNMLPYIVSKGLQGWSIYKEITLNRQHTGKSFLMPFVVIKRTSRMSDPNRAVASIINCSSPVYVDNHLIILQPKSGKLEDCRKVLDILKDERTNIWLNEKIRCRHLTVKVVSKIPAWQ